MQKSYLLQAFSYYWMKYMFIHLDILSNTQNTCSCDWLAHFLICSFSKQEKGQFRLGVCKLLSTTVLHTQSHYCILQLCYNDDFLVPLIKLHLPKIWQCLARPSFIIPFGKWMSIVFMNYLTSFSFMLFVTEESNVYIKHVRTDKKHM